MGVFFHYANHTKRERFAIGFGGGFKFDALGRTLGSRAFHLLLIDPGSRRSPFCGRWNRDSVSVIGDECLSDREWEQFKSDYVDISANAMLAVFMTDGFDELSKAAENDDHVFMELCHLAVSRQVSELEPHLIKHFGKKYLTLYERTLKRTAGFQPSNIVS